MTAREIATRYIDLFNAREFDQIGKLWAEDGVVYNGFGKCLRGKSAISAFYSAFNDQEIPPIRAKSFMHDKKANVCAVEIEMQMIKDDDESWIPGSGGSYAAASLDQFYLDENGKVKKMIAYMAPASRWKSN